MRKFFSLLLLLILLVILGWKFYRPAGQNLPVEAAGGAFPLESPQRIVSLSPSITEILYALGLGDKVCGVTRFCDYPPEARGKRKVGGFLDPDYEAILRLKADLVVLRSDQAEAGRKLRQLGLKVLAVEHGKISGILESITIIGRACGVSEQAGRLLQDLRARMAGIRKKTLNLPRPRVLVAIGRTLGGGTLENACVAGQEGFYDEMINLAGGVNAYRGKAVKFPVLSPEAVVRLRPEVILDLAAGLEGGALSAAEIRRQWETIPGFSGRKVRVRVLGEGYMLIPGPRFILILEKMARMIHPEVEWNDV